MRKKFSTLAFVAAFTVAAPAIAQNAVVGFTGGSVFPFFSTDETLGWVFSTENTLNVTSLGWWATEAGATQNDHMVGLWGMDGTLLGSANVTAGAANDGIWRFVDVGAFEIGPGSYHIGGVLRLTDGDAYITNVSDLELSGPLTFLGAARSALGSGFTFPNVLDATVGRFGPNFRFDVVRNNGAIPEPATWAMLIAGFGLVGAVARRRRPAHTLC